MSNVVRLFPEAKSDDATQVYLEDLRERLPALPERPKVELDPDQERVRDQMIEFAKAKPGQGPKIYTLHGLAGTGKTTVLAEAARESGLPLMAPTGKAAAVLRAKTGLFVDTMHSAMFRLVGASKRLDAKGANRFRTLSDGRKHEVFLNPLAHDDEDLNFRAAEGLSGTSMLDECSMVGKTNAETIINAGVRIIAVGDPGQLPPVQDQSYFDRADFALRKIHRQAQDSGIIRQAWAIRHGRPYVSDGEQFVVQQKASKDQTLQANVIICWRRATRDAITDLIRGMHGLRHECPQAGEPVICLKNDYRHDIWNGTIGILEAPFEPGDRNIWLNIDGHTKMVPDVEFVGMPTPISHPKRPSDAHWRPVTKFDFGYAITCHKAQGSEWPFVIVMDEMPVGNPDRTTWVYTAVTRAQKKCLVIPT